MNDFLVAILNGINSVIHNYGWSMVVFTLLIKLILLPLDYKSRKSMRRMTRLQPQVAKLQKKYANDKEKLNQKTAELYRREGINPMSGCLPMLVSMVILFIMFAAMRTVANTEMASQALGLLTTGTQTNESWLWIKNIWMPDSPFNPVIADSANLRIIPADIWAKVFASLDPASVTALAQYYKGTTVTRLNRRIVDELIYERTAVEARVLRDFSPRCTPEQRAFTCPWLLWLWFSPA